MRARARACARALLQKFIALIYPNYYLFVINTLSNRLTELVAKSDDFEDEVDFVVELSLHLFKLRFLGHPCFIGEELLQILQLVSRVL